MTTKNVCIPLREQKKNNARIWKQAEKIDLGPNLELINSYHSFP